MLRDIQELTYQEIADKLHLPEGTVKSRINRGRTELARQIQSLREAAGRCAENRSIRMNLTTDRNQDVSIVRVNETRLMYPILSEFASTITSLIGSGDKKLLLDLSTVTYVDSATIGCLMDLYRQANAAGGALKLVRRAEAGGNHALDDRRPELSRDSPDEASAIKSFGA